MTIEPGDIFMLIYAGDLWEIIDIKDVTVKMKLFRINGFIINYDKESLLDCNVWKKITLYNTRLGRILYGKEN